MGDRCVYSFLADDGTVKVGVSEDVERRKKEVQGIFGKTVVRVFKTEPMNSELAFRIEKNVHEILEEFSIGREWFNCSFEDSVKYITMFDSLKDFRQETEKTMGEMILNLTEENLKLKEENDTFRNWISRQLFDLGKCCKRESLHTMLSFYETMISFNADEMNSYQEEKTKEELKQTAEEVEPCHE